MTTPELTSAVSAILAPMGVHHVDISSEDVESDVNQQEKQVVPLYAPGRVMAAATLLEVLNISYVSPRVPSENPIAQREATHFRQTLRQSPQLCSVDSPTPGSYPAAVVFTGADDGGLDGDVVADGVFGDVVIVVGDGLEILENDTSKTVLWLHERMNASEIEGLLPMNLTESPANIPAPLNDSLCTSFHMDSRNSPSSRHSCLLTPHTLRKLTALSDALSYVAAGTVVAGNDSNTTAWNASDEDFGTPLEQFLRGWALGVLERKRTYAVAVYENGELVDTEDDLVDVANDELAVPQFLLHERDFSNRCDVNCHLCDACVPELTSNQNVMLSSPMEENSVLIVGLFPVSRSRGDDDDSDCSVEDPEGLEAADWFLNAVESYKDKYAGAMPNVTVGGVVLDTCGRETLALSIPRDIEACRASYKDVTGSDVVVQSSRVIAYVDYKNYAEHVGLEKPVMTITDDEYSISKDSHVTYFLQMSSILMTLNWSYLKVVVPRGYIHRPDFHRILRSKGLCIAEEILVSESSLDVAAARVMSDALATLFLTDHSTTLDLLDVVRSRNASARLRYVFMPWNSGVIYVTPQSNSAELAIVTEHVIPESFEYPRSRDLPNPWRGTLEKIYTNQSSRLKGLSLVPLAVDTLMASLGEAYGALCPEARGVCGAMRDPGAVRGKMAEGGKPGTRLSLSSWHELNVFAVRRRGKVKIGRVDLQSEVLMNRASIKDIAPSQCPGWCPHCLSCSTSSSSFPTATSSAYDSTRTHPSLTMSPRAGPPAALHIPTTATTTTTWRGSLRSGPFQPVISIPGDILIAGVFPVHRAGKESFTCGGFVDTVEERRAEQAFLFALDTAKKRYSNLLPGVEVGGILLDSCSDLAMSLHMLGRFESCELPSEELVLGPGREEGPALFFGPVQVIGYVLQDDFDRASVLRDTVRGLNKMATISSVRAMKDGVTSLESPQRLTVDAILNLFSEFDWSHAHILTSEGDEFMDMAEYFVDEAGYRGVCVVRYLQMIPGGSNVRRVAEILSDASSTFVPVILFLSRADAVTLFRDREMGGVARPWVISMIGDDWLSTVGVNIPWGALLVDVQGKVNDDFQVFLEQFSTFGQTALAPWWQDYLRIRVGCLTSYSDSPLATPPPEELCAENPLLTGPMYPSAPASRVIRGVDSLLHALDARYTARCPETHGICRNLSSDIVGGRLTLADASFMYEEGLVSFDQDEDMEVTLSIMSYQPGKLVMAGTYRSTGLSLNASLVQFFSSRGQPLPQPRPLTRCPSCTCINVVTNVTRSPSPSTPLPAALARWLWREKRGVFIREVWAWTVLAVVVGGAVITMFFIFYVMFKVWQGALARRYIGLGLLLLVSITLLYLSALPFLFTPSPSVCGLRYLFPALAFCLCFACVLVKLMALQDYRTIGLGGELCGVNQGLCVFFVLLVQVSISGQWWAFNEPFLHETLDVRADVVKYSCHFLPRDFALNLCFVAFLILLCALYSLSVRREKKNMGEARLLLAGSWACLVLWLGWVPVSVLVHQRYASVLSCAGIVGTASALLLVVYVPKVRMVARLKYDIAKKQAFRNGYSIDTDFLYERPYSLPGTLTSTYSSIRTYPKSVAATNFDSSLSY